MRNDTFKVFQKLYPKTYQDHHVELTKLTNRPQRHTGYQTKTFAVKINDMYIGITKAFITHSHWEKYPFNQEIIPYTERGRQLYLKQFNYKKKLPLDRPPLYDINTLIHVKNQRLYNFEYFMNREYAYNRDKGRCKICGTPLEVGNRECHHLNPNLPLEQVNKVPNLAWLCSECHKVVHGKDIPSHSNKKQVKKIMKYRELLQAGNDGDVKA